MDIAVLGATGTLGALVAEELEGRGHKVRRISRSAGADARSIGDMTRLLSGADAVVDATNSITLSAAKAVQFFSTVATNVALAATQANVGRILLVSIYGAADPAVSRFYGYYRGKAAQEQLYRKSPIPSTIVRSTQWFELIPTVVKMASLGPVAMLPSMLMAPVSAEAVARLIADDLESPGDENREISIRGSERVGAAEAARHWRNVRGDIDGMRPQLILEAPYLGREIARGGLIPHHGVVDELTLDEWLRRDRSAAE